MRVEHAMAGCYASHPVTACISSALGGGGGEHVDLGLLQEVAKLVCEGVET